MKGSRTAITSLFKKKFIRNIITLSSGAALAQIITISLSPLITRLYGPEAFGLLGTFNSLVIILSTIAALTYPLAIVIPKKEIEAKLLIRISFLIGLLLATISFIVILLFSKEISNFLNIESLAAYLFLLPLILFFSAGRQSAEQWLIRKKKFKITARISIIQSVFINMSKVTGGFIHPAGSVLILISTFGHAFYMCMLMWNSKDAYVIGKESINKSYRRALLVGHRFRDFPLYRSPQVLIAAVTQSMPILLLTTIFGPIAAGFYTLGMTVLSLPSQLIGKAVGDVFYPRIAEAVHNQENLSGILKKATILLSIVGLIPFSLIIILGPSLFSFIFGSEWETAGEYASWVALWSYMLFISNPSIKTLAVILEQKFYLVFTVINIIVRGISLLIGGFLFKDDILAIALYSISGALLSVLLIVITYYKCLKVKSKPHIQ